ncbi:MAG: protein-signal peptide and transmembrane prediction, partial [Verrucomicrobia bacterium]|nr:protein-signal peptide and transmembrane prediction [Verrucomicrobiota bacterium]
MNPYYVLPRAILCALFLIVSPLAQAENDALVLKMRSRSKDGGAAQVEKAEWDPKKTALIICDMWDDHWCKSASRRVSEMAPALNETIKAARAKGIFI